MLLISSGEYNGNGGFCNSSVLGFKESFSAIDSRGQSIGILFDPNSHVIRETSNIIILDLM